MSAAFTIRMAEVRDLSGIALIVVGCVLLIWADG